MGTFFEAEFFKGNRANLRKLFAGTAPIVLTGNASLQKSSDETYTFRQDSSFWYLTGIDEPEAVLVMDKDKEYLIVPKREGVWELFDGLTDYDQMSKRSGVDMVLDSKEGWEKLTSRLKKTKHFATVSAAPNYIEHYRMYTNPARQQLFEKIKIINPELTALDLRQHLTKLRAIKQPQEIEAMKQAITITRLAFKEVAKKLAKLSNEYEAEALLSYVIRNHGAEGQAYEPVVATGINAATVHHRKNSSDFRPKELLLIDAGAEVEHYAADITRMFAVHELTKRQQTVFDSVKDVYEYALGLLRPGVILRDYEQAIEQYMGEKLRELGLIKLIDRESVRKFYPQLTSHFLGLDVHDVGEYDQPLQAGMVITVEPGIYIPKERIGIRLEDDVLVTATGVQVLSKNLPFLL